MATPEDIQRRVQQADTARSERRATAAQQVGELARRRTVLAEQLDQIERELGDVLGAAQEVIDVDELAKFTDVPAADLTRWLTARPTRKTNRTKSKQPAGAGEAGRDSSHGLSARTPTTDKAPTGPEQAEPRTDSANAEAKIPAEVA